MFDAPNFEVNLPATLQQASFYTEDPFTIFELENFVDDAFYADLVADVAKRQDFDRVFTGKGDKKKFSLGGHNIADMEDCPFKTFVTFFLSQSFFDWFAKTHLPHFEVKGKAVHVYDKTDPDMIAKVENRDPETATETFYNTEVHYSSIQTGGFIPPHTDSPKKRLSLVFYLPSDPVDPAMAENLGTVFYKPSKGKTSWQRFQSGLLNEKATAKFHDKHTPAHITKFRPNTCAGFIKSDVSWHAVAPNAYDYDRRAIVINILEM